MDREIAYTVMLAMVAIYIIVHVDTEREVRCPYGAANQGIRLQWIRVKALRFWTTGFK